MGRTEVHIESDPSRLGTLRSEWDALAAPTGTPLTSYEWLATGAQMLCPPDSLRCVAVRREGKLVALAPLVLVRRGGERTLQLLGESLLHEPSHLLYCDREALASLAGALLRIGPRIVLSRLILDPDDLDWLKSAWHPRAVPRYSQYPGAPYVAFGQSWSEFESSLSSRRRSDLRRMQRKAEALGEVAFEVVSPQENSFEAALGEFVRVEAASWKGRSGTALQQDQPMFRFYKQYAQESARQGTLRLCFLKVGGRTAAAQLALESHGRFWILKIGHDEAFEPCSPGALLMHKSIQRALESGLAGFEFLGHDEPWLEIWTETKHPTATVTLYPFTASGLWGLARDTERYLLKRLRAMKS